MRPLRDLFIIFVFVALGVSCILDERILGRTVGHLGGACWLFVSGALFHQWCLERWPDTYRADREHDSAPTEPAKQKGSV